MMKGNLRSRGPADISGDSHNDGQSTRRPMAKDDLDIAVARRVLKTEIAGLEALAAGLDEAFAAAIEKLASVKGRIIVTGIGKSGHVARKIAATLASTGTSGAVRSSRRGEPRRSRHDRRGRRGAGAVEFRRHAELADMLAYAKRFRMPLVAMTSRAKQRARRCRRRDPAAAAGIRGLLDGPGADHLDHHDDGAGRRAGGGAVGAQGLHLERFPAPASRRPIGPPPVEGGRHHAWRATISRWCRNPAP